MEKVKRQKRHDTHRQVSRMRRVSGFTLIETLVAISVLLVGIAAPLSLASQSLAAATRAKERLTATYLALEGIEYVRMARDTNVLAGVAWLDGLDTCQSGDRCTIEPSSGTPIQSCERAECGALWFNEEDGIYGYNEEAGWAPTSYVRSLYLDVAGDEAEVVVRVSYASGFLTKDIIMREHFKQWQ